MRRSKYRNRKVFRTPDGIDVIKVSTPRASRARFESLTGIEIDCDPAELRLVADSLKEYRRWLELIALESAGQIAGLRKQVPFALHGASGEKACKYVADFVYVENGQRIVEDVKGRLTAMYKLKKKMLANEYGVIIRET